MNKTQATFLVSDLTVPLSPHTHKKSTVVTAEPLAINLGNANLREIVFIATELAKS
jgi:hypothetical protein